MAVLVRDVVPILANVVATQSPSNALSDCCGSMFRTAEWFHSLIEERIWLEEIGNVEFENMRSSFRALLHSEKKGTTGCVLACSHRISAHDRVQIGNS